MALSIGSHQSMIRNEHAEGATRETKTNREIEKGYRERNIGSNDDRRWAGKGVTVLCCAVLCGEIKAVQ